jgi:ferrous iron transport protein B
MLIWFASNYPKNEILISDYETKIQMAIDDKEKQTLANELKSKELESSYLGIIGHASEPFFAPLGFDWKLTIALETGLAAKEVVVATLGILYGMGDDVDENSDNLLQGLKSNIPLATAVSFIVFVMIYLPCLAASLVFAREAGGWKYLVYLFIFTTTTAWIFSFIAYRITLLLSPF